MEIKRRGITLEITEDYSYDDNPRNNDNLGTMICFHRNYRIGDKNDFASYSDFNDWLKNNKQNIKCILPVYLLDHSGLSVSVYDFNDRWDSGQIGYIFCTSEDVEKFGYSHLNKHELSKILIQEIKDYDDYISGANVYYQFRLTDEDDNVIDAMTGFLGNNTESMLKEMKEYVEQNYHFLFDTLLRKQNESCM